MKKILIIIGNLNVGGAEQHLLRVLPKLNHLGLKITVYTTNHRGTLAPAMEKAGVSVIAPHGSEWLKRLGKIAKPVVYLLSMIELIWVVKKIKPHVVHYFLPGAYLLGSVALWGVRCDHRLMSRRIVYTDEYRNTLLFKFEKFLHKRLDYALACSQEIKQELIAEGIPPHKVGLIYNGVELANDIDHNQQMQMKRALQIDTSPLIMVIVANLYQRKGHIYLLRALAQIKKKLPHGWKLLLVGRDGGEHALLKQTSERLGLVDNLLWLGMRLDTPNILACADFGILSSLEEGFSNALLECMASRLPMVVTDVSGSNEAIIDGINGLVVPPGDSDQLAAAILCLAADPARRTKMSEQTLQRVTHQFTLDKTVSDYHEIYTHLS